MKRCKKCGELKSLDEFYRAKTAADGHRPECKECARKICHEYYVAHRADQIARVQAWRAANPERNRETQARIRNRRASAQRADHLKRAFGLTVAAYEEMFIAQGEACAICRRSPSKGSLHVDHDHVSGDIRGLLCFRCNNALGLLCDDEHILLEAIEYLKRPGIDTDEGFDLDPIVRARAAELREVPV